MKKIVSMALIAALIVSAAGCGEKAPAETTAKTETTTAATEIDPPSSEYPNTTPIVDEIKSLSNSSLFFKADNNRTYVYNIAKNELFEIGNENSGATSAKSMGNLLYFTFSKDIYSRHSRIIHAQSNEVLIDEQKDDYKIRIFDTDSNQILVTKLVENFSGNKLLIGMLNDSFEWVYQLSEIPSNVASIDDLNESQYYSFGDNVLMYNYNSKHAYIYTFKNNTLTVLSEPNIKDIFFNSSNGKLVCNDTKGKGIWAFDNTGTIHQIYGGGQLASNCAEVLGGIVIDNKAVLSWSDYKDMGFNLSGYNVQEIKAVTNNVIIFSAESTNKSIYTIIMDKAGKLLTDPIKGVAKRIALVGDYAIIFDYSSGSIVNCTTGEIVSCHIKGYDPNTSMLLVNSIIYDQESGKSNDTYYLADPSAPDTLLNPFELAQN